PFTSYDKRSTAMPITLDLEPQHEKASELLAQYDSQLDNIRSNANLSAQGRQDAIAKLWGRTAKALNALSDSLIGARKNQRSSLERQVFGLKLGAPTEDVVSYRDANERVSEINDAREADDLLSSAVLGSDTILAKALLARAFANGWVDIVNAYVAAYPNTEPAVDDLWNIAKPGKGNIIDTRDWLFQPRMKPIEIQMFDDATLIAQAV
ncbi:hypothetical protein, partial [Kitasatospora herbaricolor]|uniref:hypothetical protein n=1 Tax=Kitasatospora herbaricolor TaxID=68217 RepID=UPI0036D79430